MQRDCRDYPSLETCQETSGDGRKLVTFSVLVQIWVFFQSKVFTGGLFVFAHHTHFISQFLAFSPSLPLSSLAASFLVPST